MKIVFSFVTVSFAFAAVVVRLECPIGSRLITRTECSRKEYGKLRCVEESSCVINESSPSSGRRAGCLNVCKIREPFEYPTCKTFETVLRVTLKSKPTKCKVLTNSGTGPLEAKSSRSLVLSDDESLSENKGGSVLTIAPQSESNDSSSDIAPKYNFTNCGHRRKERTFSSRILNGREILLHSNPWLCSLSSVVKINGRTIHSHLCGAILIHINPIVLLSSAHCVMKHPIEDLRLLCGSHKVSVLKHEYVEPTQYEVHLRVSKIIVNQDYYSNVVRHAIEGNFDIENLPVHSEHDIALIRPFDHDIIPIVTTANGYYPIYPICLPSPSFNAESYEEGVIVGWGRTTSTTVPNSYRTLSNNETEKKRRFNSGLRIITVPKKAGVRISSDSACQEFLRQQNSVEVRDGQRAEVICTEGESAACQGDSGGPLAVRPLNASKEPFTLVGLVSKGWSCGVAGHKNVYTPIHTHLDWIERCFNGGRKYGHIHSAFLPADIYWCS